MPSQARFDQALYAARKSSSSLRVCSRRAEPLFYRLSGLPREDKPAELVRDPDGDAGRS